MFAQANSEHCRHKIFNADFAIDGEKQPASLFKMIRRTSEASPDGANTTGALSSIILGVFQVGLKQVINGILESDYVRSVYQGERTL